MIELPKEKVKAQTTNPKKLVIYSPPKAGKTTALSFLPNNLIIDLEGGADFLDALKIRINNLDELNELCTAIEEAGKPYTYITLDTVTALEEMVLPLAAKMYKETPMGKNFTGTDVRLLPNGAGYLYIRLAFNKVIDRVGSLSDYLILIGHIKDKFIEKKGKEVSASDIDLTGKLKSMICANADAIGYLYKENNETHLNFNGRDDLICGARPVHLRNKDLVIGVYNEEKDEFKFEWSKVYK